MTASSLVRWVDETTFELGRQFRWSYLPPLMVYLAAGVSGIAAIGGTLFVKEHLGLSAAFLAGSSLWMGILSALEMSLGHLVEVIALCHQAEVSQRGPGTQFCLTRFDRAFWDPLYRLWSRWLGAVVVVEPGTVVRHPARSSGFN